MSSVSLVGTRSINKPIFAESGYLRLVDGEGLFALNVQPSFSILRLAVAGNNLTQSDYHVVFEASDGQHPPRTTRKRLTVYHEEKKPSLKKAVQLTARIREDVPKGSFIVQIGANSTADRFKLLETKDALPLELDEVNGGTVVYKTKQNVQES